jgi:formamidopyrimidine-DNA glycosylase
VIELPEAVTIARQLDEELKGKRIVSASSGTSNHKWVFYTPTREELEEKLPKETVSQVIAIGRGIHFQLVSGLILLLDDFGGKVYYHNDGNSIPKKYHLLIEFNKESFMTVTIQGWGFIALLTEAELRSRNKIRSNAVSPVSDAFTFDRFTALFDHYDNGDKDSIKTFFTNGKNVAGIGNGYLQDILFHARIDPRRKVNTITTNERRNLYLAVKNTIAEAISENGRGCERDIYGIPGNYHQLMDRYASGNPCFDCGTTIQKIHYLGGSCYICPNCQK